MNCSLNSSMLLSPQKFRFTSKPVAHCLKRTFSGKKHNKKDIFQEKYAGVPLAKNHLSGMVRRCVYPLFSYFGVSDFVLTPVAALRRVTGSGVVVRGECP